MSAAAVLGAGLFRIAVAAALLLALALIGYALTPDVLRPRKARLAVPFALAAGLLATGWLSWLAGFAFGTWAVGVVWAALVTFSVRRAVDFARDLRRMGRHLGGLLRSSPCLAAALAGVLLLLVPALFLPLLDSDGIRYQVAQPKLALMTGRVETYPWDVTGFFPQIAPMLYLVATALGGGQTCKFVHAAFAVSAAGVLALLVHRSRRSRRAALAAPLLALVAPVAAAPATAAFIDHVALYPVVVAALLVAASGPAPLVGLVLGTAFATKMTTGPAVAGLAFFSVWQARPGRRLSTFLWILGVSTLAFLPFGLRNVVATGDPFFPLGRGLLGLPIPGVTPESLRWAVWFRDVPRGLLAFGWFPGQPGMAWDDQVGPHVLLALFLVPVLFRERRLLVFVAIILPSLLAASLWHPPARYFLPLFWALSGVLAVALARFLPRALPAVTLALAVPCLWVSVPELLRGFDAVPHLLGRVSGEEVLRKSVPGYRAARFVSALPGASIMALDFPGPYYLDRPWVVEGVLNTPPLATWVAAGEDSEGLLASLQKLGVRHLLVTPGYGGGTRLSLLPLASNEGQARAVLELRARLHLLSTLDGVDVYEVPAR